MWLLKTPSEKEKKKEMQNTTKRLRGGKENIVECVKTHFHNNKSAQSSRRKRKL